MDNNKRRKLYLIQCIGLAVLSLLMTMLPYLSVKLKIPYWDTLSYSETFTGMNFLTGSIDFGENSLMELEIIDDVNKAVFILAVLLVIIPVCLMLCEIGMCIFGLKKNKVLLPSLICPAVSFLSILAGTAAAKKEVNAIADTIVEMIKDSAGEYGGLVDLAGSFVSSEMFIEVKAGAGIYVFSVLMVILLIESAVFCFVLEKKEYIGDGGYISGNIFKKLRLPGKEGMDESRPAENPARADVWRKKTGMLTGVRGEYAGAEISIADGEIIAIGRNQEECSLILNSRKVSRKHCAVLYDGKEDDYILINYSLNGTYLSDGRLLEQEKLYHVPHGTVFYINTEEEFKLL